MTLIEIIKTSLLGFSALFVLTWIFFYLFLKIKKSNNQVEENNEIITKPVSRVVQRPMAKPSPVFVQPVIYPSVSRMNQQYNLVDHHRNYYEKPAQRVDYRPRVSNRPEKFVVFNNRQYSFYNV
jgi:hypothetical protein